MKLFWLLPCILFLVAGCATDQPRASWIDEVMRDARGDNMKMRHDFSGARSGDAPAGRVIGGD